MRLHFGYENHIAMKEIWSSIMNVKCDESGVKLFNISRCSKFSNKQFS